MKTSDFKRREVDWRNKYHLLKTNSNTLHYRRCNWKNLSRKEFLRFILRIATREQSSWLGPVRSQWRNKRKAAVEFYENKWKDVWDVFHLHTLRRKIFDK